MKEEIKIDKQKLFDLFTKKYKEFNALVYETFFSDELTEEEEREALYFLQELGGIFDSIYHDILKMHYDDIPDEVKEKKKLEVLKPKVKFDWS